MALISRTIPSKAINAASFQAYRSFSTTLVAQRGPVEATKDVLKKADRTVSDAAVKGIDTGEKLTRKAQETIGAKSKETERKAKETAGEAKEKAKGKAEELQGGQ